MVIKTVCSYCKKVTGYKWYLPFLKKDLHGKIRLIHISHGICDKCFKKIVIG